MSSAQHIRIDTLRTKNVAFGDGAHAGDNVSPADEPAPADTDRVSVRMGFAVDVMGYSGRSASGKQDAQRRVADFVEESARRLNVVIDSGSRQSTGDGMVVFLPSTVEVHRALPTLIRTTVDWLASDNQRYRDRIRLRMAVVIGPVGPAPIGFSGNTVVECCRLVDSKPLRDALIDHLDADLAVLISEKLYAFVIGEGHPGLDADQFRRVHVQVKDYEADAWLWEGAGR